MDVMETEIPGIRVLKPRRHGDERGFFCETYNRKALAEIGISEDFVQDNQAFSAMRYVLRGLHYQKPPRAQAKLVRVSRGAVFDVVVDIRRGSPTFGRWMSVVLSAGEGNQIYVPGGFAHGYCTLEPDSEVLYKVSDNYAPETEAGLRWNDPDLAIRWPAGPDQVVVSAKDQRLPLFAEMGEDFSYAG